MKANEFIPGKWYVAKGTPPAFCIGYDNNNLAVFHHKGNLIYFNPIMDLEWKQYKEPVEYVRYVHFFKHKLDDKQVWSLTNKEPTPLYINNLSIHIGTEKVTFTEK